ncbi:hypothetical protein C8R42DRAFT_641029 [Lentinula raphanica]|nr:hypothetical protein C8R42DRAFT_641029 [Lentinula raphanica]
MPCCFCTSSQSHSVNPPYPYPHIQANAMPPPHLRTLATESPYPHPHLQGNLRNPLLAEQITAISEPQALIPKPKGEVCRPGRGGYNLEHVLGWDKDDLEEVKRSVKEVVAQRLDCAKSFTKQSTISLESARQEARLQVYANLWVINDLIRIRLMYERTALKRREISARDRAAKREALLKALSEVV